MKNEEMIKKLKAEQNTVEQQMIGIQNHMQIEQQQLHDLNVIYLKLVGKIEAYEEMKTEVKADGPG